MLDIITICNRQKAYFSPGVFIMFVLGLLVVRSVCVLSCLQYVQFVDLTVSIGCRQLRKQAADFIQNPFCNLLNLATTKKLWLMLVVVAKT